MKFRREGMNGTPGMSGGYRVCDGEGGLLKVVLIKHVRSLEERV